MNAERLPDPAADDSTPPAEAVVAARFDERPGYAVHRRHGAPSWLLIWTVSGAGAFRQGEAEATVGPGDLLLAGPDLEHSYAVAESAAHWGFWWVHCPARPDWTARLRGYAVGSRLHVVGVPANRWPRVDAAFGRLHGDARWSGVGVPPQPPSARDAARAAMAIGTVARDLASNAVAEIVLLATGGTAEHADGAEERVDERVRRVEAVIEADPAAAHTVSSLAGEVALSPSRLAHLFVAETGRTPMRALRDARMRHASRLLEVTELTVEGVARSCGYPSVHHFSRLFRDRFGLPPATYRAHLRAGEPASGG